MSENEEDVSEALLNELNDNREKLHLMLSDVDSFRKKIDTLLPQKVDYKFKWMLAERIKTMTEVIKSELAIRKQIDDSIRLEVDVRKKLDPDGDGEISNIRALAKAIEHVKRNESSLI